MKIYLKVMSLSIVLLLLMSLCALSQESDLTESEKVLFAKKVVVPSPADLFMALEKLGNVNWEGAGSFNKKYVYNTDYLRALNLGIRGADGFIAIQDMDKAKLGDMINIIIRIAEELGASGTILNKREIIEDYAKKGEWYNLRMELNDLRDDVEQELIQQGDTNIALLLIAGGWINGLCVTSNIISANYSEGNSTILYQPALVEHFETQFNDLDSKALANPVVKEIANKIPEIKKLIDVGFNEPIPEENVKKLYNISSELIKAIERG